MELENKGVKGSQLKNMIIKRLYFNKAMSCAGLSDLFDKSIPSIAKAINELMHEGFVVEHGYAPSSGGRRPLMYSVKANAMYILAVALDQLTARIQLFDLQNGAVADMLTFELKLLNNANALTILTNQINSYIKTSGIAKGKIAGIGIGMPGFINVTEGINYTYLDANGSLTAYLTEHTGITTYIDNDSSLIALAEQKFGIAKSQTEVMVINHNGFAGELSHIPLSEDGSLCECGKRGCLEAEASMLVVARKAIEGIQKGRITSLKYNAEDHSKLMGDALLDAANNGDQFAIELLSDAGYKIGKALAILIHIMNPANIVLSGRGAKVAKILMAPIQQALHKYCIPRLSAGTELLVSELGFDAELVGAAVLVMENFDKTVKAKVAKAVA